VGTNDLAPSFPSGFAGDNSQPPAVGSYTARAHVASGAAIDPNEPIVRTWRIYKVCSVPGPCDYQMEREVPAVGREHGTLVPGADGWRVTFPTEAFRDACPGRSGLITVKERSSFVIHFDNAGRTAQAHEHSLYSLQHCGAINQSVDWQAELATF
jgi:hypothetical protein